MQEDKLFGEKGEIKNMKIKCQKCCMNKECICDDTSDECIVRTDAYNTALTELLNALPDCDYIGIEHLVCIIERLKKGT